MFRLNSNCVELQPSTVAQSYFLILSYTRKSDLVVSEVQMILVSHSLWNLSFYHGPLPPPSHPRSLFPFLSASLHLCNSASFLFPSVASFCHILCSLLPYLSYLSCLQHLMVSSPPSKFHFYSLPSFLHPELFRIITLLPPTLQVMWTQVKARWWATCFISWATSTNAPCINMSRSRRRREKHPSPMLGFWMKLARKETGTCWRETTDKQKNMHAQEILYLCCPLHIEGSTLVWFQMDKDTCAMQILARRPLTLEKQI